MTPTCSPFGPIRRTCETRISSLIRGSSLMMTPILMFSEADLRRIPGMTDESMAHRTVRTAAPAIIHIRMITCLMRHAHDRAFHATG